MSGIKGGSAELRNSEGEKDYSGAERAYFYEMNKAAEGTTFSDKYGHVHMMKKARPAKAPAGQHPSSGKRKAVHQPPANATEVDAGRIFVQDFKDLFQMKADELLCKRRERLRAWCLASNIAQYEPDFVAQEMASQRLFDSMEKLPPYSSGFTGEQRYHFMETSNVPGSGKKHGDTRSLKLPAYDTSRNNIHHFERGQVEEMPGVSLQNRLSYSWGTSFPVSTIGEDKIHAANSDPKADCGVVSMSSNHQDENMFNGFRFPRADWLTVEEQKTYIDICKLQDKCAEELGRGADVASLSASFSGIGYKWDRDTNNKSMYTDKRGNAEKKKSQKKNKKKGLKTASTGGRPRAQFVSVVQRMRNFVNKVLLPKLKKYMYLETVAIEHFYRMNKSSTYCGIWTSVTTGGMFWPRSHIDADLTGSMLVCADVRPKKSSPDTDTGVRGGDWSFAESGHVLKSESGCLFYYHPWLIHGTTKFAIARHLRHQNVKRYYSACYGKEDVIRGAGTVLAVALRKDKRNKT